MKTKFKVCSRIVRSKFWERIKIKLFSKLFLISSIGKTKKKEKFIKTITTMITINTILTNTLTVFI
jgi:hypothetical protein